MNPYYHHPTQTYYNFRHPSPFIANPRGWIYDPMTSTATYDCLVVLNPFLTYHQQPLRYSYTHEIPNLRAENTFWDRLPLSIPYHPLEPNYRGNPFFRLEQEGSLVLEEITVNQSATTSTASGGLSEETITQRLQASMAAQEKTKGEEEEESDVCAICLEGYDGCKKMARLDCGHGYHPQCIKTWLLRKNVCPMCKATAFTM